MQDIWLYVQHKYFFFQIGANLSLRAKGYQMHGATTCRNSCYVLPPHLRNNIFDMEVAAGAVAKELRGRKVSEPVSKTGLNPKLKEGPSLACMHVYVRLKIRVVDIGRLYAG